MNEIEKLWERCGIKPEKSWHFEVMRGDYPDSFWCNYPIQVMQTYKKARCSKFLKEYPKFTLGHRNALEEMLTNFEVSVGVDYVKYLVRNINSSFIATYDKTRDQAICALVNELLDNGILTVKEVKDKLCII